MTFLETTTRDFDKLADEVSTMFLSKSTPLKEAVVKVASREELNPEELKRLVERSNTSTVLGMLQNGMDKKAEITLAEYSEVYSAVFDCHAKQEPTQEKTASVQNDDSCYFTVKTASTANTDVDSAWSIPDFRTMTKVANIEKGMEKKASTGETKIATTRTREIFQIEQNIAKCRLDKVAAETSASNFIESIITEFSKYNAPSFSKFANEAFTLHGNSSVPVLTALAKSLDEEAKDLIKVAGVVNNTTNLHSTFGSAMTNILKLAQISRDLESHQVKLEEAYKNLCK